MDIASHKKSFLEKGYLKVNKILSESEIATLKNECQKILLQPKRNWSDYKGFKLSNEYELACFADDNVATYVNVVGFSHILDSLLERILTDSFIQTLLKETIGPDYKLWQVNLRNAEPGGYGMLLHQDSLGETGLSVLIDDSPTIEGSTVFLPKSHLFPLSIQDTGLNKMSVKYLYPFLEGVTGSAGDMCFFFNRIYHGRYRHHIKRRNLAIIMSFFPVGARYHIQRPPSALLKKLGPELQKLLDPDVGVKHLENGMAEVISASADSEKFSFDEDMKIVVFGPRKPPIFSLWGIVKLFAFLAKDQKLLRLKKKFFFYYNKFNFQKKPSF